MTYRAWPAAALLVCAMSLDACRRGENVVKPLTPVRVQVVTTHDAGRARRYSASISPYAQVALDFKVSGYVREILQIKGADGRMRDVQEGDEAPAGTVLARLNDSDFVDKVNGAKAQLAAAQADLTKATQEWQRASNLWATQSITAPDYDRARKDYDTGRAQVDGARAQLAEAQLNLGYCALSAPMNGVILQRNIEVGSLASPGATAFQIADVSSVKVVFGVPDVALRDLKMGSPLAVVTESLPAVEFHGRITEIAPSADPQNRVFDVEVTVPNRQNQLKVGMVASLQLAEGTLPAPVPVVPLTAIVRGPDDASPYAVFVIDERDGTAVAHLRAVRLGDVFGNLIAVPDGVAVGDSVIVTGATLVTDDQRVQVIP
jgi:RND family efflux transporter MFP subunit